jgi:RNA polymerase sigma factor (sigma-70 family)
MNNIIDFYYANNAKELRKIVNKILASFGGIFQEDYDDFYSLANETFVDVLNRYDELQNFNTFLYSCLDRKIKTEMTRRNRYKRRNIIKTTKTDEYGNIKTDDDGNAIIQETIVPDYSIYQPLGDEDSSILADTIASDFDIEKEFFEDKKEYSEKMTLYLSKLSNLQKKVLELMAAGYSQKEIQAELNISAKEYTNCDNAIHAYRNISILF